MDINSVNGLTTSRTSNKQTSEKKVIKTDSVVQQAAVIYSKSKSDTPPVDFKTRHIELSKLQDTLLQAQINGNDENASLIKLQIRDLMSTGNDSTPEQLTSAMKNIKNSMIADAGQADRYNTLELLQ